MTLFGLCHAQKNAFAFFVALSFGKIAVGLSGLDFCLPIAPRDIDGVLMIFLLGSHAELKRKEARLPSRHKNSGERHAPSVSIGRLERSAQGRFDARS